MTDREIASQPRGRFSVAAIHSWLAWLASTPGRRTALLLVALIVAGVGIRLYGFNAPILDHHFLRQADTAAIARNFAEGNMNILMPQVDWRGASPGYVEAEFQLYSYATAVLYRLFGEDVRFGRLLNIALYVASSILQFHMARRMFDSRAGVFAVLFFGFAGMNIYFNRVFQPDTLMVLASMAALHFYWVWSEEDGWANFALSALGLAIALLIKPINVYLALPLLYLSHRRFGWALFLKPQLWLYGGIVLAPPILWYMHAYGLWLDYGNTLFRSYAHIDLGWLFGSSWPGPLVSARWSSFASDLVFRLFFLVTSPAGILFVVVGSGVAIAERKLLLGYLIAGFAVTILVFGDQHRSHDYYQLPMVYAVALLMGAGAARLWAARQPPDMGALLVWLGLALLSFWWFGLWDVEQSDHIYGSGGTRLIYLAAASLVVGALALSRFLPPRFAALLPVRPVLGALIAMVVAFGAWQASRLEQTFRGNPIRPAYAERIAALTARDEPLVIAYHWPRPGWVQHRTAQGEDLGYDPVDFFLSRRKGWSVQGAELTPDFLEELRRRGARAFATYCCVSIQPSVFDVNPALRDYLACAYPPLEVAERWWIYRLDEPLVEDPLARCATS
jgi:4-amino-4-deoxy-L-arabinose transferase-like glycosyltransferase